MPDHVIHNRHEDLRERALPLAGHPDLDRPISRWVTATDLHLPQKFLTLTVKQLLDPRRWKAVVSAPGVGATRLNRLLDLVERALERAAAPPRAATAAPEVAPFDPDQLDEAEWAVWSARIRRHRLGGLPVGRFAAALADVSGTLWAVPLGQFLDQPLAAWFRTAGMGSIRGGQVLRTVAALAAALAAVPDGFHLSFRPTAERLHGIACWLEAVLAAGVPPDDDELDRELVRPLLAQFQIDLSEVDADLVRRRWGVDGPSETLQQLADELDLTRERIRQVTDQPKAVLAVRWPEGRALLVDFYALLVAAGDDAADQRAVVRTVAESCYDLLFPAEGTRRLSTRGRRSTDAES